VLRRHGARQQKSLQQIALQHVQAGELALCLNPFGYYAEAQCMGH